jgi:DNA-directed RNA polymerase I, II, and III subunit RPABC2
MDYISTKQMTKFERARILGTRAYQISLNADIMVDPKGETDPLKIAEMELREKKLPINICRYHPNGVMEEFSVQDLIINED